MPINMLITPLPWLDHDAAITGSNVDFCIYSNSIRINSECKFTIGYLLKTIALSL